VVFLAASALGLNFMDSLFIAAALSISSTAIIIKVLEDTGKIKKESSILVLGVLIVEDVIAVILIASLESIALVGTVSVESVVLVALVAAGLIVGTFTIGRRVIPPLIDKVASAENREILLLSVLGVCFGYAFLAGVLVAESKSSEVSKILSSPIKDMFVAIFFVSVGALMDITQIESYIFIAIVLIAVTTAMKLGANLLGNTIFKQSKEKSLRAAFALSAPRGEFSIVIVKVGVDAGVVSAFLFPLIGLITIITAFMTPFFIRLGDKIIPKFVKSK
jgi:CPA2 family monovalent cation:H+ antiporter-2